MRPDKAMWPGCEEYPVHKAGNIRLGETLIITLTNVNMVTRVAGFRVVNYVVSGVSGNLY